MEIVEPVYELEYAYKAWKGNDGFFSDETAKSLKACRAKYSNFGNELNNYELAFCNYVGKRILEV